MIKKTLQKDYNGGFTLVELMVAMVISGLVIAGIIGVYTIQQRSYTVQEQVSELQQKGRSALDFMARDIRMAGFDDADNNCTSGVITTANPTEFAFETCNTGGKKVTVTYSLDGTNLFWLEDDGVAPEETEELLLEGVDGFEFLYFDEDGNSLSTDPADPDDIQTVRISMLVRSTYPDPKYTDSVTYKPGSGLPPEDGPLLWGAYNDHFHRRLFITSVQLRNM
ncbi:MAG: prepilin-type N-terminal cleavage/methylation domain-containing protein [Candidatus Electrothrix sp. YB6]